MKNEFVQAERLKTLLLKIYQCKKGFELLVIDKKPKRGLEYILLINKE